MSQANTAAEELHPTGIEGATDTNYIPWIAFENVSGFFFKPLRASSENGFFSCIAKIDGGTTLPDAHFLSGMDMLILSGSLAYSAGGKTSELTPGTWGYIPSSDPVASIKANEDTEILATFYGAAAFVDDDGKFSNLITSRDILAAAKREGIDLVPNTLAACMDQPASRGRQEHQPLAIADQKASELVVKPDGDSGDPHDYPHENFVDTRDVPWIVNEAQPDIALKIMRVSEETGVLSLIVRHNGVAGAHAHLGCADFLILHGRLGYRAGPKEGYGPGVWVFEPAGARHEATQRVSDEDLIYTANVYGPIAFDSGPGTAVTAVLSFAEYKALAQAAGARLVPSESSDDETLIKWQPLSV